jgi:predicted RNase H-like HicB family nuclease
MKHSSRKYTLVYRKEEEGGYSGHCLELPGAISQGETLDELKENMVDAILLILDDIKREAEEKKEQLLEVTVPG